MRTYAKRKPDDVAVIKLRDSRGKIFLSLDRFYETNKIYMTAKKLRNANKFVLT